MSTPTTYDQLYARNYRADLSGYEIARYKALDHFISRVMQVRSANKVLDYGAGSGLYLNLWENVFPEAELSFFDISSVARDKFREKYPEHAKNYFIPEERAAGHPDADFDVVVSVEVMEHVEELNAYLADVHRLLKPGGLFIWTTPCANSLSIEHLYAKVYGKIEKTKEGYRRWTWEDPTHVRRLKSCEIQNLLKQKGFSEFRFRYRAHLFSFLCTYLPIRRGQELKNKLMTLDYTLFRCLTNGASMIGAATKPHT